MRKRYYVEGGGGEKKEKKIVGCLLSGQLKPSTTWHEKDGMKRGVEKIGTKKMV